MFKATVIGHLGKDAEIRKGKNDKEFVKFSIASTEKRGENDETVWIDVISGMTKLQPHLTKGKQVYAAGNMSVSVYNEKPQLTLNNPDIQLL